MDELIFHVLGGIATPEERHQLQRWRAASPENEATYRDVARVWDAMNTVEASRDPGPIPDPAALIARAGVRRLPVARTPPRARRWWPWAAMAAVAAAVIVLVVGATWRLGALNVTGVFGAAEFVTGPTEQSTLRFSDGTIVRLAPDTRLRLTRGSTEREVELDGRAYFAVAKMAGRPFRIRTSAGDVTVLGTRFDLEAKHEELKVIVVEGLVGLNAPGHVGAATPVATGEMTRVIDGTTLPVTKLPNVLPNVGWMGNFLAFTETPLRDAAADIARQYDVRITIADGELGSRTVTAWFAGRRLDEVLRVVCAATLATCTSQDGAVTMAPQ